MLKVYVNNQLYAKGNDARELVQKCKDVKYTDRVIAYYKHEKFGLLALEVFWRNGKIVNFR